LAQATLAQSAAMLAHTYLSGFLSSRE